MGFQHERISYDKDLEGGGGGLKKCEDGELKSSF